LLPHVVKHVDANKNLSSLQERHLLLPLAEQSLQVKSHYLH
jgi:hypothetical protein